VIRKIISGGQAGVEQAALDVAIKLEIPHGGWVPKGFKGSLPGKYKLKELASGDDATHTEKNILDSHGTLIISRETPDKNIEQIKKLVKRYQKPLNHINLGKISKFESALDICKWIVEYNIENLNVSGESVEKNSKIYNDTMDIIESAIYLGHTEYDRPLTIELPLTEQKLPKTIDEAAELLLSELPLKDKVVIANMTIGELPSLNITLGNYIRDSFGLWTGNIDLVESCRAKVGDKEFHADNVSIMVIEQLWQKLKASHRLRVVKE